MSDPSNGLGSRTRVEVDVLLILSSPLANLLKAWVSAGWLWDITTEVLEDSSIMVTGLPLVSAGVLPARAEFQVRRGDMTTQGG